MSQKLFVLILVVFLSGCETMTDTLIQSALPEKNRKTFNDASLCNDMWDCPKGTFKDCKQTEENSRCDCRCEPFKTN